MVIKVNYILSFVQRLLGSDVGGHGQLFAPHHSKELEFELIMDCLKALRVVR